MPREPTSRKSISPTRFHRCSARFRLCSAYDQPGASAAPSQPKSFLSALLWVAGRDLIWDQPHRRRYPLRNLLECQPREQTTTVQQRSFETVDVPALLARVIQIARQQSVEGQLPRRDVEALFDLAKLSPQCGNQRSKRSSMRASR